MGHSCRGVSKGLLLLIDLFLGRPHNVPIDLEVKLASEQLAHLLAELDVKNDVDLQKIEAFAELIELQMKKAMKRRSYRNDLELQQKQETIVPVYIFNSAGIKELYLKKNYFVKVS